MNFVKKIRAARKVSKYALAQRIGVTATAVERMERAKARRMDLGTLVRLKRVSGMSAARFMRMLEDEFQD